MPILIIFEIPVLIPEKTKLNNELRINTPILIIFEMIVIPIETDKIITIKIHNKNSINPQDNSTTIKNGIKTDIQHIIKKIAIICKIESKITLKFEADNLGRAK
jgi:hypothetical protein